MRHRHAVLAGWTLLTCSAIVAWTTAARGQSPTPSHVTAEVVSLDAQSRTMVIRTAEGTQQTVELDDQVAGFEGVKSGDRVILTLRNEPHHARVSSIVKSTEPRGKLVATPRGAGVVTSAAQGTLTAESAFGERVQALSEQASRVDGLWGEFKIACNAKLTSSAYDGAREWFGLWDNVVRADLSTGFCRDLSNQIVAGGTTVTQGMAAAEESAAKTLQPGAIREIRRRYSMDWSGWKQTAPDRLEP